MSTQIAEEVINRIQTVAELYHRLVLVVGPSGSGKTATLRDVEKRIDVPLMNINLELSRLMLDRTERQRALHLPQLLSEIIAGPGEDVILLDNVEILFDASLRQDPLRLLQSLSRNTTLVVAWNGSIDRERLAYAEPGHSEYKRYPVADLVTVTTEVGK